MGSLGLAEEEKQPAVAIARHVSWTGLGQFLCQSAQFIAGVALARLLTPEDFGLVALTAVFTGFAALFADLGLGAALVQQREVTKNDLDFAFWLNGLVAGAVTVAVIVSASGVAGFFHEPRLIKITRLLALCPLLGSIGMVPGSLMQKHGRFKELALIDVSAMSVSLAGACTAAFLGLGAFSLVLQALLIQLLTSSLRLVRAGWRPHSNVNWREGWRLLPFGTGLFGSNAINYWLRNGDNLLVGRFCGAVQLGLYIRAYNLLMLPLLQIHAVLGPVVFPVLSALQGSKNDLRRVFLFANQAIAVVVFPLMIGLATVADDFVIVLFGIRWAGAIAMVRVFALLGVAQSIGTTTGWIYMSVARTDRMLRWVIVASPLILSSFLLGVRWGGLGVSIAYSIVVAILWYPQWRLAGSLIDLSFRDAMINVSRPLICSLCMAFCVLGMRMAIGNWLAPPLRLSLLVLVGAGIYLTGLHCCRVPAYDFMRSRVVSALPSIRKGALRVAS